MSAADCGFSFTNWSYFLGRNQNSCSMSDSKVQTVRVEATTRLTCAYTPCVHDLVSGSRLVYPRVVQEHHKTPHQHTIF